MSKLISLETIRRIVPQLDVVALMEEGFVAYSEGRAVIPPVGELIFEDPPGETHIKYGYIQGGDSLRHQDRIRLLRKLQTRSAFGVRSDAALQSEDRNPRGGAAR